MEIAKFESLSLDVPVPPGRLVLGMMILAIVGAIPWAIALNGSFFNTQRMVAQHAAKAYLG